MHFRIATKNDVPEMVRMLADDVLGSKRESYQDPLPNEYYEAFKEIEEQKGNCILVAVEEDELLGFLQLTIIPSLSQMGMKRAHIEGVRVDKKFRGKRIGKKLFEYAFKYAKEANCGMVQLTTDKTRKDAHRFYERLGFVSSHDGMKRRL